MNSGKGGGVSYIKIIKLSHKHGQSERELNGIETQNGTENRINIVVKGRLGAVVVVFRYCWLLLDRPLSVNVGNFIYRMYV